MLSFFALAFLTVIAGLCARQLLKAWKLSVTGVKLQAIVVAMKPMTDDSNHPVVSFSDGAGKAYTVPIWIAGLNLKIGDKVEVVHCPGAPDKAQLAEPINFMLPALGFAGAVYVAAMLIADVF